MTERKQQMLNQYRFESNSELARSHIAADAWDTACLRLLDAQQALSDAADQIDGLWRPVCDSRQMEIET